MYMGHYVLHMKNKDTEQLAQTVQRLRFVILLYGTCKRRVCYNQDFMCGYVRLW